ncbi:hypothetical protein LOK74_23090 [Brevibacillus humidisoli]|uniref:hypothetical protein n=1 Tax=Brevibacillus humidisoli TaxID=2895522 RepID=UPI001E3056CC|nr:hypothetical protein [Brevibacillus humidisoli]UFJ40842.1 hypothetical protein LOK74_23090 [Brevibacillus humidisoli]
MNIVEVRRPRSVDVDELHRFFTLVITDTFDKEGISHMVDDRRKEIEAKKNNLLADLDTDGRERFFYVALHNGEIIGTIEYGPAMEWII